MVTLVAPDGAFLFIDGLAPTGAEGERGTLSIGGSEVWADRYPDVLPSMLRQSMHLSLLNVQLSNYICTIPLVCIGMQTWYLIVSADEICSNWHCETRTAQILTRYTKIKEFNEAKHSLIQFEGNL